MNYFRLKPKVFIHSSFEMTLLICIACGQVLLLDDWDDSVQCVVIALELLFLCMALSENITDA